MNDDRFSSNERARDDPPFVKVCGAHYHRKGIRNKIYNTKYEYSNMCTNLRCQQAVKTTEG